MTRRTPVLRLAAALLACTLAACAPEEPSGGPTGDVAPQAGTETAPERRRVQADAGTPTSSSGRKRVEKKSDERKAREALDGVLEAWVSDPSAEPQGLDVVRENAAELIPRLEPVVAAAETPWRVRARLIGLFRDPRFKGDPAVNEFLVRALALPGANGTAQAAIGALHVTGDAHAGLELEKRMWDVDRREHRFSAISLAVGLAGDDGNGAVRRLVESAPDTDARVDAIRQLTDRGRPEDAVAALRRVASFDEASKRAAVEKLATLSGGAFDALREEWRSRDDLRLPEPAPADPR